MPGRVGIGSIRVLGSRGVELIGRGGGRIMGVTPRGHPERPPMIEVDRLSKRYGAIRAIDRLGFAVGRGEVVGLLGPNGAGKTTTMRLLTTYLAPTSGRARVAGRDVLDDPIGVRRAVGYLPESVPLYNEMRTREFLKFRARIKDVPGRRRTAAVGDALARCGLADVADRVLGHLSRGYRQRVGLADALLNDPEVLVLDEPTSGLDPIQVREVRSLIRELGQRHTILLSTHILGEVEAVCSRAIVIAGGRLALDEPVEPPDRAAGGGRLAVAVEARGPADAVRRALESAPGVARVVPSAPAHGDEPGVARFEVAGAAGDGADLREVVAARVVQNGWGLRRLDLRRSSLEERFVEAVRRATAGSTSGGPP